MDKNMTLPTKETLPRVALESMNETYEEEIALVHVLAEHLKKVPFVFFVSFLKI
jgi:hypothetical protein